MHVMVRLLASCRGLLPLEEEGHGTISLSVPDGTTVAGLLDALSLAAGSTPTAFVNGRHAESVQELNDGDELSVFPAAGGG